MKTSLGYTPSYMLDSGSGDKKKIETYYPSLSIEGNAAKKLCRSVRAGDTITATVTFRVSEVSNRDPKSKKEWMPSGGGSRVELEARDIEFDSKDESEEEEETAESALDEYMEKKGVKAK